MISERITVIIEFRVERFLAYLIAKTERHAPHNINGTDTNMEGEVKLIEEDCDVENGIDDGMK
jgi:hypothetical protein